MENVQAHLIGSFGESIQDVDEEVFSLFSEPIPSQNLGMVDSSTSCLQVDIAGHEYEIEQSPGLLNAVRKTGTTGAVLWKVSVHVARWLATNTNWLWKAGVLHPGANVVELGCGIAGVIGISLHRRINTYVLTDQPYVLKRLQANIDANISHGTKRKLMAKGQICTIPLDWETDATSNIRTVVGKDESIDLVIACDCIYNDFLVKPFVEICVDTCKLSTGSETLLLVAQQLRSDEVLTQWLNTSREYFDIWRLPNEFLSNELVSVQDLWSMPCY